ncbi:MAG: transglycosylase domain-containing protein [Patescibacteria group bacterium]
MQPRLSPQAWKKNATRRKQQVAKKYRKNQVHLRTKNSKPINVYKKAMRIIIKTLIVLIVLGIISFAGAIAWFSKELPKSTDLLTKHQADAAKFYDRTGENLLYDMGSSSVLRTKISLNELPDYVKWSTIVAEDRNFYSHSGVDFKGILRSVFVNIFKRDGGSPVGGSSIPQQFIKNALLTPEKTYTRKIKELVLTWQIEKKFTKDEILEMYLNEIPYGGTAYGIEAAAEKYFNKHANELNLAEAATLAAFPQAPSYLSPYGTNIDQLIWRKNWILDSLAELGYLPETQTNAAKQFKLEFSQLSSSIIAPHFVFYVKGLIANEFGEKTLDEGGLKIITTLDFDKQKIAEGAVKAQATKNIEKYNANNAALVSLQANTGEVLAMVGSVDYFNKDIDGAVNVALRPRQPGSSFKPIVYTAAFIKGYSPDTILFDLITKFKTDTEDYEPHNYGDKTFGPVSIRKAFAGSLNIPAVKTIYLTGIDNVINLAEQLGYTTFQDRSRFGLSLVLGGGEVKLLEHTSAFTALARDGEYYQPQVILKITDKNNKTLKEFKPNKAKGKKIIDEEIARQITDIMSDNQARTYVFGENNLLTLPDRPVAAKTGTTNDYKDGWTIGFTPSVVTGVWVGNTRGEIMSGSADGSNVAAPIWNSYMREITKNTDIENFTKPKEYELPEKPMLNGELSGEIKFKIDKTTGNLATEYTPEPQIEEKTFREIHSILYYVNKNNPLGPIPSDPHQDKNYEQFEGPVKKWAEENGYETNIKLPTEIDTVHIPENIPNLSINSPVNNALLTTPELTTNISASAVRGIKSVEYWIDDILLKITELQPFNLENYPIIGFQNGQHILKVVAKDDVENSKTQSITINFNFASQYSQPITFIQPKNNDIVVEESFPYPIIINISHPEYYEKVDFYLINSSENSTWIGYKKINSEQMSFTWTDIPKNKGNYKIYTLITNRNNKTIKSDEINFEVK